VFTCAYCNWWFVVHVRVALAGGRHRLAGPRRRDEHPDAEAGQHPLEERGRVDVDVAQVRGHRAERLDAVDHEQRAALVAMLGEHVEVERRSGARVGLRDHEQARAGVEGVEQRFLSRRLTWDRHRHELRAGRLRGRPDARHRRKLVSRKHDAVPGGEAQAVRRQVERLGGVRQEGHVRWLDAEPARESLTRARRHCPPLGPCVVAVRLDLVVEAGHRGAVTLPAKAGRGRVEVNALAQIGKERTDSTGPVRFGRVHAVLQWFVESVQQLV